MDLVWIFESVRNIPYRIPLSYGEEDNCCSGKSSKLFKLLTDSGVKVRYRVCTFLWDELPIPESVMVVPHDRECIHTYLEIFIGSKWRILDATWDGGLKSLFHINKWDGKSDTEIAVKPTRTFTPEESLVIVDSQTKEVIEEDLGKNGEFYKAFDEWIDKVRHSS